MAEHCLPDCLTPITPQSVYLALKAAAPLAVDCELSRASLLVLLAHINEETGWKACHANNLGNVKHEPGDGFDYVKFRCNEKIDGKIVWGDATFRAFATLQDGCVEYLAVLRRRFDKAWRAVLAGDAALFAHLLKVEHYYTADEAQYTANVVLLDMHLDKVIPRTIPPGEPPFVGALPVATVDEQPTPPGDLPPASDA